MLILQKNKTKTEGLAMRKTRLAQISIFESYAKHEREPFPI